MNPVKGNLPERESLFPFSFLRRLWRVYEAVFPYIFLLLSALMLATKAPIPVLGAAWWPLWAVVFAQAVFVLRYSVRSRRGKR